MEDPKIELGNSEDKIGPYLTEDLVNRLNTPHPAFPDYKPTDVTIDTTNLPHLINFKMYIREQFSSDVSLTFQEKKIIIHVENDIADYRIQLNLMKGDKMRELKNVFQHTYLACFACRHEEN